MYMNCPSLIGESVSPTALSTMSLLDPELVLLLPIHNRPSGGSAVTHQLNDYQPINLDTDKLIARSKFDMLKALLIVLHTPFLSAISYYDVTRLAILPIVELITLPYRPV